MQATPAQRVAVAFGDLLRSRFGVAKKDSTTRQKNF